VPDAGRGEGLGDLCTLRGGGRREPLPQLAAPRVDAQLASGLRIDEPQEPDVGELLLARVADLDGDDVVPSGEVEQRAPPVPRATEVRDDHDE